MSLTTSIASLLSALTIFKNTTNASIATKLNASEVGQSVAPLVGGLIPANYIPSSLDEVLEYNGVANFPAVGNSSKIYIDTSNPLDNDVYRWSGSDYFKINDSVSTSDKAGKLVTARNISMSGDGVWVVSFDGSADSTAVFTLANTGIIAGEYQVPTFDSKGRAVSGRALTSSDITTALGFTPITNAGNIATADKLSNARSISMTGDITWSTSFDGSGNVTAAGTLANVVVAGSGIKITYNAKGLVTGSTGLVASDIPNLDWNKITSGKPDTIAGFGIIDALALGSVIPAANGTAVAGTANTAAHSDHVHPLQTTISGNAGTATKLATIITINGVNFDGSANINVNLVNSLSFSTSGNGDTGSFNGSAAKIISFNSVGAPSINGTNATGTWGISITGTAAIAASANALNTANNYQGASLGIGTAPSGVAGEIRATGNITGYYSDDRLKTRIGNLEHALDKVCSLSGFIFINNATAMKFGYLSKDKQVGVSAQEVQRVLPEAVTQAPFDTCFDDDGKMRSITGQDYLTVYYEKIVPLLIEAIKELREEVNTLKNN